MKITIAGSLGNIGKPLAENLVSAGHSVTVISSRQERENDIVALGATAAIGSVNDAGFLTGAFNGADAVFTMTPPNMGGAQVIANTIDAGKAFAAAIKLSGVKRVVMLSSIGADLPEGNGPIAGLHHIEEIYQELDGVSVTFLRAGFFYNNFYNDVPLIKGQGITGGNYPGTVSMPLVHPRDIAKAAAEELQQNTTVKNVRYVVGDIRKPNDAVRVLGAAAGLPELPWIEFTDEQSFQGMVQAGLPDEIAGLYTEMGAGFRKGMIQQDFEKNGSPVSGQITLEDFATEFAKAFN
ncbi:NmrA family NAD(P)-binding protein [Mucilaginibacter paludis]|uniref:TrkA-N domain protein n=1 Tax=Mucilaginibacter paludis DSM 18603 TaxID=714943 RepID=H1YA78_9SPHI|nr:NmrA family NAD(P)-binding protein [Mucilaginibacter paludis]EHQ25959.1 TrkA-N domain protein [Mucilaginibacter paludis DSM 18603]